jgi:hypothetical protein
MIAHILNWLRSVSRKLLNFLLRSGTFRSLLDSLFPTVKSGTPARTYALVVSPPPKVKARPHKPLKEGTPNWKRTAEVFAALDRACAEIVWSYSRLVAIVRKLTGRGCSHRTIARWKKERGFIQVGA